MGKRQTLEDYHKRHFWYRIFLPQSCMNCKKILEGGCWGLYGDEGFIKEFRDFERIFRRCGGVSQGCMCSQWK